MLVLSPRRIVVGGGIVESRADRLLPMVRRELAERRLAATSRPSWPGLDGYVVAPRLLDPSPAIAGALALAGQAAASAG